MLCGAVVANREKLLVAGNLRLESLTLAVLFVTYFGAKLLMSATGFWQAQFVIHLITVAILLLAFRVCAAESMQGWLGPRPGGRLVWALAALAAGLLLGLGQQWRGAHFMSHTLWSGWLCWCLAWSLDAACRRLGRHAAVVDAA